MNFALKFLSKNIEHLHSLGPLVLAGDPATLLTLAVISGLVLCSRNK